MRSVTEQPGNLKARFLSSDSHREGHSVHVGRLNMTYGRVLGGAVQMGGPEEVTERVDIGGSCFAFPETDVF